MFVVETPHYIPIDTHWTCGANTEKHVSKPALYCRKLTSQCFTPSLPHPPVSAILTSIESGRLMVFSCTILSGMNRRSCNPFKWVKADYRRSDVRVSLFFSVWFRMRNTATSRHFNYREQSWLITVDNFKSKRVLLLSTIILHIHEQYINIS